MIEHTSKVDVPDDEPPSAPDDLPIRAGDTLEEIGRLMLFLSVVAGGVGIFAFGRIPTVTSWGISYEWHPLAVLAVLIGAVWAVALSWAVYRAGTTLRWIEAIGRKLDIK
ncbi:MULTISPECIES: hypothetical protein [Stenotrophomonas]|uniref:hypothetical protein n=1 Tax=Stenotrophomonas TaxID=40323 RepID=UPI003209CEAD